jgi:hypothetical protein
LVAVDAFSLPEAFWKLVSSGSSTTVRRPASFEEPSSFGKVMLATAARRNSSSCIAAKVASANTILPSGRDWLPFQASASHA